MRKKILFVIIYSCLLSSMVTAQDAPQPLALQEFVTLTCKKDVNFEIILLDELIYQYQAKLGLTAADLLIAVKGQYNLSWHEDEESGPEGSLGLSKLFPGTGTELGVTYGLATGNVLNEPYSRFTAMVAQPIAENAFGHANRLAEKISGLEIELAQHQMVEAYQDYLAQSMKTYYSWYAAQMRVTTSETTFRENRKLLENVRARKRNRIADQSDVNKIHVQVLSKESTLISLKKTLLDLTLVIRQAIGVTTPDALQPMEPETYHPLKKAFAYEYAGFVQNSRTQHILKLLERKNGVEVAQYADQLLPSIEILLGYTAEGSDEAFAGRKNAMYAGLAVEIPFLNDTKQWRYALAKTKHKKTKLANMNTHKQLRTDLETLYTDILSTQKQLAIAKQKVSLSEAVLKSETKYYMQSRAELNDLILAGNDLEENRYQQIYLTMQYNILMIEWLRLTDQLIRKEDIRRVEQKVG